jgi:hypothetical protein
MKCYFDEEKECPLPDNVIQVNHGEFCCACSSIENNKSMKALTEGQARMVDAMTPAEIKGKPDTKEDVQ